MDEETTVAGAVVRAAWDSYRVLDNATPADARDQAHQRLQAAVERYGSAELHRGAIFLIGVLFQLMLPNPDATPADERIDPVSQIIPAVLTRLQTFETVDTAQVPMVAGLLTAAALGQNAVSWRDRYGDIPPTEGVLLSYTLWLMADLFDMSAEQPGSADRTLSEAFDLMDADNVRKS